jgi:sugar phosphate isomerase/epimerase
MITRRAFLERMGAAALAAPASRLGALPPKHHRSFPGPYGIQLYSLRHQLQQDVPGSLKLICDAGYTDVETAGFYTLSPEDFKQQLDAAGLKCTGMHSGVDSRFRTGLDEILREAGIFKTDYIITPWVAEERRQDVEGCKRVAGDFNNWGKKIRAAGYGFAFHNHESDFKPLGATTAIDTFIQETDPTLVDFELDLFFAQKVGIPPADFLRKYPGRFKLVHLKDVAKTVPPGFDPTPDNASVPLGQGQIDWPRTLAAAADTGVKYWFVEEESDTAPEGIREGIRFLKTVKF